MTRVFTDAGVTVPVTVIEVLPNRVTQLKTEDNDGYSAVQVAGLRYPSGMCMTFPQCSTICGFVALIRKRAWQTEPSAPPGAGAEVVWVAQEFSPAMR